jgi:hypothetical protein
MPKANFTVIAGVIAASAAVLSLSAPVEAGTCQPVDAKGKGKDIAMATTRAQADLAVKAAVLRGRVTQTSTNCVPGPAKVVCKISAVVCPNLSRRGQGTGG